LKNIPGREFYAGLLEALTQVMGSANGYLRHHGPRVGLISKQLGAALGLSGEESSGLFFAAVLADMGMVGLAEDAWEVPVPTLPPAVRARVERHPLRSEEQIASIPHLEALAPLARHHHEWWDGSGYPDGLKGDQIPIGAQILRLADTVVALDSKRPQRSAVSRDEIVEIVEASIGREFGPEVARTYLSLQRGGEIAEFDAAAYRHTIRSAAEQTLPDDLSALSSAQLLSIVANLIDAKDTYTAGHSGRVAVLAVAVADQLGLPEDMKDTLWSGGYLHDLGKLRVPVRILSKPESLTEDEFRLVQRHPTDGAAILEGIPALRHLTTGARYHHERWDGSGYPEGLKGDRIPLIGQIMAVCDAYDAMTSERAYRESRGHEFAAREVARHSGSQFSPMAAGAFLSIPERFFEALHTRPLDEIDPFRMEVPTFRSPQARNASVRRHAG
jgi:HD-GYP domain-containing protein (c-di-GMP phosphodiesterase class II)